MLQIALGMLSFDDKLTVAVPPALTLADPVPTSNSPLKSVTVYVPGFMAGEV